MKRLLVFFLVCMLMVSLCSCSVLKGASEISPGVAEVDDCIVEITDCKAQVNPLNGSMIAVVWVDFTNNSKEAKSLFLTAKIKAYQNGVELSTPSVWSPSMHDIERDTADDVLPGYSLSTGLAFDLEDTSTPILLQICVGNDIIGNKIISEISYDI